jgi:hypothetical protein
MKQLRKLIKRNGRLGQIATFSRLLVLVEVCFCQVSQFACWVALLISFALSQIDLLR